MSARAHRRDRGPKPRPRSPRPPTRRRSRTCGSGSSAARPSSRTCCAASPSSRPSSAARSARPPTRRARRSSEPIERKRRRARRRRARARGSTQDRVDVTLPADPLPRDRASAPDHATRREIEDVFIGLGFSVAEGPEVERVYYNFDALNVVADAPVAAADRHLLRRAGADIFDPDAAAARPHLAGAGARDGAAAAADLHHRPGRVYRPDNDATHTPQFHQIEGLAVDEDVTLADLKGTLLDVRARDLRPRARGPAAPALLPVHRAERRGRRVVLQLHRRRDRRRLALPALQGLGLDRDPRRRDGRPERVRATSRDTATTPSGSRGSRSGWGSSGSRCSSTASPTCGCSSTTTSASWSSSEP